MENIIKLEHKSVVKFLRETEKQNKLCFLLSVLSSENKMTAKHCRESKCLICGINLKKWFISIYIRIINAYHSHSIPYIQKYLNHYVNLQ